MIGMNRSSFRKILPPIKKNRILVLYNVCTQNDISNVLKILQTMKVKEINYQNPFDGNTILHEVTRLGYIVLIKLLLKFHAARSLFNYKQELPSDLAFTDEIRALFKRSSLHVRFSFIQKSSFNNYNVKCKSCSLVDDHSFYEWELVDSLAYQNALRLRDELRSHQLKISLEKRISSIDKGYLKAHFGYLDKIDPIRYWFNTASEENKPLHIFKAYSISQEFTKQLNKDLARNIIHDLKNGCSIFSCNCLYSTQDATKSITTILLYHPPFQSLKFAGIVYRGAVIDRSVVTNYNKGSRIITTTFLSTSRDREVANIYYGLDGLSGNNDRISLWCQYTIKSENRTALYIAPYSEHRDEEEVLILPYSSFLITDIREGKLKKRYEIYLEECDTISIEFRTSL